jgi:hypothetical protein
MKFLNTLFYLFPIPTTIYIAFIIWLVQKTEVKGSQA